MSDGFSWGPDEVSTMRSTGERKQILPRAPQPSPSVHPPNCQHLDCQFFRGPDRVAQTYTHTGDVLYVTVRPLHM